MRKTLFLTVFCLIAASGWAEDMHFYSETLGTNTQQIRLDFSIDMPRFFTTPTWDGSMETIPVTMEQAIKIARQNLPRKIEIVNGQIVKNPPRPISTVNLGGRNNRWWYTIQFKDAPTHGPDPFPTSNTVIVLMDGSVVTGTQQKD